MRCLTLECWRLRIREARAERKAFEPVWIAALQKARRQRDDDSRPYDEIRRELGLGPHSDTTP